jgi:hypothetical protein
MTSGKISPLRPYMLFTDQNGNLTKEAYDFLYAMFLRVGGSLESLNAATLEAHTWEEPGQIGFVTPSSGKFTSLAVPGPVTFNPVNSNITITPIGVGGIQIKAPLTPGTIDNMDIGQTGWAKGKFTQLASTGAFGCNNATPQPVYYLDPSATDTAKIAGIYAALVANGILTDTP